MILFYKNSILASVVSILGCGLVAGGVMLCVSGDFVLGIPFAILGLPMVIGGRVISENKAFKKWWAQNVDSELQARIAESQDAAITVYNQNPQRRTIKKIAELNPEAAKHIEQRIQELMAKRRGR